VSASAMACPSPLAPPVTSALRPFRSHTDIPRSLALASDPRLTAAMLAA